MASLVDYENSSNDSESECGSESNGECKSNGSISESSENDATEMPSSLSTKKKRRRLTMKDKLDIIEFAEKFGNRAAERTYKVCRKNIRSWRQCKKKLKDLDEKGLHMFFFYAT